MTEQTINTKVLSHELQLGEQLNKCVHANRRSDFGLMLAMLAEDVRAQSQFLLPKFEQGAIEVTDETLRHEFQLPKKAPISLNSMDDIKRFSQAELVANQHLADIQLLEALSPQPLAFRDDDKHIRVDVLSNTSIHCQNRYHAEKSEPVEEKKSDRLAFNAKEWLTSIQTTLAQNPLGSAESVNAYS